MKRGILAIFLSGAWIGFSEFVRNELLFKGYWIEHYQSLGLAFPSLFVNNIVWVIWSFVFAAIAYWISRRFRLWEAFALMWVGIFVMMWLAIGNLNVLPFGLLPFAVPLSLLEAFLAVLIAHKVAPTHGQ